MPYGNLLKVYKILQEKYLQKAKKVLPLQPAKEEKFLSIIEFWLKKNKIKNYFTKALRERKECLLLHPL